MHRSRKKETFFRLIHEPQSAIKDERSRLAVLREGKGPKTISFVQLLPWLEQLNREHETSVKVVSARTIIDRLTPTSWRHFRAAVGKVKTENEDAPFPMMPMIVLAGPNRKFGEKIGFQPDFDLYENVPFAMRTDECAWFIVPKEYLGIANAAIVIPYFTSNDWPIVGRDRRTLIPVSRTALVEEIPELYLGERHEPDPRFGLPIGEENFDLRLPYYKGLRKEYFGPTYGTIDMYRRQDNLDIELYGDWSRPTPVLVEIPVADMPKLRQALLLYG